MLQKEGAYCYLCHKKINVFDQAEVLSFKLNHQICNTCAIHYIIQLNLSYITKEMTERNLILLECPCKNPECRLELNYEDFIRIISTKINSSFPSDAFKGPTSKKDKFKKNIANDEEKLKKLKEPDMHKCYIHREENAYGYCQDCRIYFCEICKKDFIKEESANSNATSDLIKMHENHKVYTIQEAQNKIKALFNNLPNKCFSEFQKSIEEKEQKISERLTNEIVYIKGKIEQSIEYLNREKENYINKIQETKYKYGQIFKIIKILGYLYYTDLENSFTNYDDKLKYLEDVQFVFSDIKFTFTSSENILKDIDQIIMQIKDYGNASYEISKIDLKNFQQQPEIKSKVKFDIAPQNTKNLKVLGNIQCELELKAHSWSVLSLLKMKTKNYLVSSSVDRTVKLWDLNKVLNEKSQTPVCIIGGQTHSDIVKTLAETPNGFLVTGAKEKTIKIWDIELIGFPRTIAILKGHKNEISKLVINNNILFSSSLDAVIIAWDLTSYKQLFTLHGHTKGIYDMIPRDENQLISSSNMEIKIWDIPNQKDETTLYGHDSEIYSLVLISKNRLISSGYDKQIIIWDLEKYYQVSGRIAHNLSISNLILFENRFLISSSWDKTLIIWDISEDKKELTKLGTIYAHTNEVLCLCDLENGLIASGSDDNLIKIWNLYDN